MMTSSLEIADLKDGLIIKKEVVEVEAMKWSSFGTEISYGRLFTGNRDT